MLAFVNETSLENVARFRELEASMFQELEYSCEIDQKQYFFQFKPKIDKADHAAARHSWKDLATIVVGIFGVKNAVCLLMQIREETFFGMLLWHEIYQKNYQTF